MDRKKVSFLLMFLSVTFWGLDYSVAKNALDLLDPMSLMFFKYAGGLVMITAVKLAMDRKFTVRKKDIAFFVLCSLTGQILYYFCEYSAMEYIPVSLITIVLAFVPGVSIVVERIIFKKHFSARICAGLIICVIGVALVIGADFKVLLQGRAIGYILAFGAVLSWTTYNFITAKVSENYTSLTMSFNQILCTVLLSMPYAFKVMPPAEAFTPDIIISLLYLGLISAGLGYMILVRGIGDLGPTVSAMFNNFLPVTSTFFGWLILGQNISPLQIVGGIIVVIASCVVITEKGKLEKEYAEMLQG